MINGNVSMLCCLVLALAAPVAVAEAMVPKCEGAIDCACGTGAPDQIVRGGWRDFRLGEAAFRRFELATYSWATRRSDSDDVTANRRYAVTLRLPPGEIVRAELAIRMQPVAFLASNDLLYLGRESDREFTFFWRIEELPEVRSWEVGHEPAVFRLELGSLPDGTNLIPKLNAERTLDVEVQDDTTIGDVSLAIWNCPRQPVEGGERALE